MKPTLETVTTTHSIGVKAPCCRKILHAPCFKSITRWCNLSREIHAVCVKFTHRRSQKSHVSAGLWRWYHAASFVLSTSTRYGVHSAQRRQASVHASVHLARTAGRNRHYCYSRSSPSAGSKRSQSAGASHPMRKPS